MNDSNVDSARCGLEKPSFRKKKYKRQLSFSRNQTAFSILFIETMHDQPITRVTLFSRAVDQESHIVLHYSPRTVVAAGLFWKIHGDTLKSPAGGRGRACRGGVGGERGEGGRGPDSAPATQSTPL